MNKFLKFLLIANSIHALGVYLLIPIFVLFVEKVGGGAELAGILFATQFIVSAVGSLVLTKVKDRKSLDNKLLRLSFLIHGCAWLLLAFVQTIPAAFIAQIATGIGLAIGSPSFFSLISEHLDKNKHISDWSMWSISVDLPRAVGSFISGFIIIAFGFTPLFLIMALLEFISLTITSRAISAKSYA